MNTYLVTTTKIPVPELLDGMSIPERLEYIKEYFAESKEPILKILKLHGCETTTMANSPNIVVRSLMSLQEMERILAGQLCTVRENKIVSH